MVAAGPPDVILLDVHLPDLAGLEAYQRIRDVDGRIPVIFITWAATADTAIEAMKDTGGGELTITSQLSDDHELLISVGDTGVGLPTENPDQIFESFVTTKPNGTGMGLAITRSIVADGLLMKPIGLSIPQGPGTLHPAPAFIPSIRRRSITLKNIAKMA